MTLQETLFWIIGEEEVQHEKKNDFPGGPSIVEESKETICRYALNTRRQNEILHEAYTLQFLKRAWPD